MICRGGIVTDNKGGKPSSFFNADAAHIPPHPINQLHRHQQPLLWFRMGLGVLVVWTALSLLPHRASIAPLVESDYCYLMTAADRLYDGQGLTTTPPVAPHQSWNYTSDWTFLTRWPAGYSLIVWGIRSVFGVNSIQAAQWIGLTSCALAFVGWFVFIKRSLPDGVTGVLMALVAAGSSVSVNALVNPSTDAIIVGALPWLLLWTANVVLHNPHHPHDETNKKSSRNITLKLAVIGFAAGLLFWVRYASLFIPFAIGFYLLFVTLKQRHLRLRQWLSYSTAAVLPVAALVIMNKMSGSVSSVQSQLNLGSTVHLNLSPSLLSTSWWNFTQFGFYNYHTYSHWLFAWWPVAVVLSAVVFIPLRKSIFAYLKTPAISMSVCVVASLMAMLITTTALFGEKYDYVGLARYYLPVKPLYFLLFVSPLMLIPRRVIRVTLCVAMLMGCNWLVQVEWPRPYKRWVAANRQTTDYGQWSQCFEPGANQTFDWIKEQRDDQFVVVSNFHEYIALETKIPALPIPPNITILNEWLQRICETRKITDPRVVFVLDPNNKWRSYWIPDPQEIIETFDLRDEVILSENNAALIFMYDHTLSIDDAPTQLVRK